MEPISLALMVGAALAGGSILIAGIASLFSGDEHERQIKNRAKDARHRMNQASREYLQDVDQLVRRKR